MSDYTHVKYKNVKRQSYNSVSRRRGKGLKHSRKHTRNIASPFDNSDFNLTNLTSALPPVAKFPK